MTEIKLVDPLLKFLHSLLENDEEKKILSMIFKDYPNEKILESLIEYKENKNA